MTSISINPAATVGIVEAEGVEVTVAVDGDRGLVGEASRSHRGGTHLRGLLAVHQAAVGHFDDILPGGAFDDQAVAAATVSVIGAMPAKPMVWWPAAPAYISVPASGIVPAV